MSRLYGLPAIAPYQHHAVKAHVSVLLANIYLNVLTPSVSCLDCILSWLIIGLMTYDFVDRAICT